jgi:hypothetical protein
MMGNDADGGGRPAVVAAMVRNTCSIPLRADQQELGQKVWLSSLHRRAGQISSGGRKRRQPPGGTALQRTPGRRWNGYGVDPIRLLAISRKAGIAGTILA